MKAIFLSGNSVKNRHWIEELEGHLKDLFEYTNIQYYKHWEIGEESANYEYETEELIKKCKNEKDYIIIAKSVGTYLTLKAISKGIKPKKLIFFGFPHNSLEYSDDIARLLKSIIVPILFIQNEKDPYCSYNQLLDLISKTGIKDYKTYEFKGNESHWYSEYYKIKEIVMDFIEK